MRPMPIQPIFCLFDAIPTLLAQAQVEFGGVLAYGESVCRQARTSFSLSASCWGASQSCLPPCPGCGAVVARIERSEMRERAPRISLRSIRATVAAPVALTDSAAY